MSSITLDNYTRPDRSHFESHWYSGFTDFVRTCWVRVFGASKGPSSFHVEDRVMAHRDIEIRPEIDAKLTNLFHSIHPSSVKRNLSEEGTQLKSGTLSTALMSFQNCHPNRFIYTDRFFNSMFQAIKESDVDGIVNNLAEEQTEQTDYVIVPLVVEKSYLFGLIKSCHISQVAIDLRSRHVIYYDPKTKDPRDVTLANNLPLMTVIQKLADRFIPREEDQKLQVYYNTQKHQHDGHNCGIFVLVFLNRLLEANSLETLQNEQLFDYSQTIEKDRQLILEKLTPFMAPYPKQQVNEQRPPSEIDDALDAVLV